MKYVMDRDWWIVDSLELIVYSLFFILKFILKNPDIQKSLFILKHANTIKESVLLT